MAVQVVVRAAAALGLQELVVEARARRGRLGDAPLVGAARRVLRVAGGRPVARPRIPFRCFCPSLQVLIIPAVFARQVGVWSPDADLQVVGCSLAQARWRRGGDTSELHEQLRLHCFNLRGTTEHGEPLALAPLVRAGCARTLWFGMALPSGAAAGDVMDVQLQLHLAQPTHADDAHAQAGNSASATSAFELAATATATATSWLRLRFSGEPLEDLGDAHRWRLSRLRWLDSTLGHTALPPAPFGPVTYVSGRGLRGAQRPEGRAAGGLVLTATMGSMLVGSDGLPTQLHAGRPATASSDATKDGGLHGGSGGGSGGARGGGVGVDGLADGVGQHGTPVLESPLELVVTKRVAGYRPPHQQQQATAEGQQQHQRHAEPMAVPVRWRSDGESESGGGVRVQQATAEKVRWSSGSTSEDGSLRMSVWGTWWFDAQAQLSVTLTAVAGSDVEIDDVSLRLPVRKAVATYAMGFGEAARRLDDLAPLQWRWGESLGNYQCWLGDVGAGVRLRLTGATEAFESPQHLLKAEDLRQTAWHNGGLGGATVGRDGLVRAHSGARTLRAGSSVTFTFELLLTPCKPLDTTAHFGRDRYYQVGHATPPFGCFCPSPWVLMPPSTPPLPGGLP